MTEPSPLAKHHEGIFKELTALVKAARKSGDTPGDVRAVVEILIEEAIKAEAFACPKCSEGVKHLHPVTYVTGKAI